MKTTRILISMGPTPFLLDNAELLPEGPNLYAYVGNNPINWTDPYGLAQAPAGGGLAPDPVGLPKDPSPLPPGARPYIVMTWISYATLALYGPPECNCPPAVVGRGRAFTRGEARSAAKADAYSKIPPGCNPLPPPEYDDWEAPVIRSFPFIWT